MVEKIVTGFNPGLMNETGFWDFEDAEATQSLAVKLVETMTKAPGIGLAANQIGINKRVFAFLDLESPKPSPYVVFNPIILGRSAEIIELEEGCLSFLDMIIKIKRPAQIKVEYQNMDGSLNTAMLGGLTSRIWQHEIDHLDGVLFFNRASRWEREKAVKEWRKKYG